MFSDATLNAIRERMNIVDLVGEYVQLKKSGQAYQGLCPFHSEKSPSFYVHPLKQVFRCFGCQKGGNVFTFLMSMEGLSFPEAVQKLADRTGVRLEHVDRKDRVPDPLQSAGRLLAALDWASRYFHYLLTEVAEYRWALEYARGRGLTDETIRRFQIGVGPKGWNTLLRLMLKRQFTFAELVQAGLVVEREASEAGGYDRFRERLMFPIRNREGQAIGFGARALKEQDQPKYLNSPESPIFSKRRLLYGMFEGQRGIRQMGEVILVEGYMDVIGLHQAGIQNAVATMGTALTEEHCAELKTLTRRAVTVFDPDRAGNDAWHRSVHLFLSMGFFAKDLSLPEGKDPDEYVQEHGAEKFQQLCAAAPRQITKLLKEIAKKGPLSESEVAKTLSDLTPLLIASRRLPDRAVLWDDISLVLGVSLPVLTEIAEAAGRKPAGANTDRAASPPPKRTAPSAPKAKQLNRIDLQFFAACVSRPELFLAIPRESWLQGIGEASVRAWLDELTTCANPIDFRKKIEEMALRSEPVELVSAASAAVFEEVGLRLKDDEFGALVDRIRERRRAQEIHSLSAQVKLSSRMGDAPEGQRLLEDLLRSRRGDDQTELDK